MQQANVYVTNHHHSKVLCEAFAQGCNGRLVPPVRLLKGPAVVYGILRGCGEIIRHCEWLGRDYYHIDHGYIGRGHYGGYYRVSKNALQAEWPERPYQHYDTERFERLKLPIPKWRKTGRDIVVAPISTAVASLHGIDCHEWINTVLGEIPNWTERPVVIKEKGEGDIREALKNAWCLVTYSSNAAIDAILAGVPAIVLGPSAAETVAWDFEDIESPVWPDLDQWLHWLAWQQWTVEEMKSGRAWAYLRELP